MATQPFNVLVTGVGAIIGYGLIKSLHESDYACRVVGIDIFADAVGQKWADRFIQGVRADDAGFIDFINTIVADEKIDLVIPGIEQDLKAMIEGYERLDKRARYALNNKALYKTFDDKKLTYRFLRGKIPLIAHIEYHDNLYEEAKEAFGLPFVLKQDVSYAGKGVALIHNEEEYAYYLNKFGTDCMAQQRLETKGHEYTCAIFGLGDGTFVNPICLQRELSQEGATKKARNVPIDEKLYRTLTTICEACRFEGPTNVQFIEHQGEYLLLEINARVSSSTSIRKLFGVNEAQMCIEYYLLGQTPKERTQRYGTVMRYIEDAYFDSDTL